MTAKQNYLLGFGHGVVVGIVLINLLFLTTGCGFTTLPKENRSSWPFHTHSWSEWKDEGWRKTRYCTKGCNTLQSETPARSPRSP